MGFRRALGPLLLLAASASPAGAEQAPPAVNQLKEKYGATVDRILAAAKTDSQAHEKLRYLCDRIGNRLSGSEGLTKAVAWATEQMKKDGLDNVRPEPVMVPHWVRGEGTVELMVPRHQKLQALAIGNSVGTEKPAAEAEVLVARDWKELEALGDRVKGKIVLFHHPMRPFEPGKDTGYGESVDYRVNGASLAAKQGAIAVLACSATARSLGTPHTGSLHYEEGVAQIPAACLSPEDSAMIVRLAEAGEKVVVRLSHTCRFEPDVPCANVVGEVKGAEKPEEI